MIIIYIHNNNLEKYIDKRFMAVADLWDSMELDSRKIIMIDFANRGIIQKEDAIEVAELDWKKLPIEFKLLIIGLEMGIDLDP